MQAWPQRSLTQEHGARAELFLRLILIMRPAAELDVIHGRRAARCVRHDVMEFQESWLSAASLLSHKRTATAVARPNGALHRRRDVPPRMCTCAMWQARLVYTRQLRPLQVLDQ